MKTLDLRHETQLLFEGNAQSDTISYKVIDQEIRLFDKDSNPLGYDLVWKIEQLTARDLSLLLIAREHNTDLVRLRYRAQD
jgi:hypothetical protein